MARRRRYALASPLNREFGGSSATTSERLTVVRRRSGIAADRFALTHTSARSSPASTSSRPFSHPSSPKVLDAYAVLVIGGEGRGGAADERPMEVVSDSPGPRRAARSRLPRRREPWPLGRVRARG